MIHFSLKKAHKIVNGVELNYCCRCQKWKTLDSFYKDKRYVDGLSSFCKDYYLQYSKKYRKKNKIKIAKGKRKWDLDNPEKRKAIQKRHNSSLKGRLSNNIRRAINRSLKGNRNGVHWEHVLGYTFKQLKAKLTRTMPKDYTWIDYLNGKLHIDHIVPIFVFNFEKPEDRDFKRCWALENLQLLPAVENMSKGTKLTKHFQPSLLF